MMQDFERVFAECKGDDIDETVLKGLNVCGCEFSAAIIFTQRRAANGGWG